MVVATVQADAIRQQTNKELLYALSYGPLLKGYFLIYFLKHVTVKKILLNAQCKNDVPLNFDQIQLY